MLTIALVALGSVAFGKRIRALSGDILGMGIAGRRALRRRVTLAELRQALTKLNGVGWEALAAKRGNLARPLFLWAGLRWCGCTLSELGAELGGMSYAAVSIALKRLAQRSAKDEKMSALQNALSRMLNVDSAEKPSGRIAPS